MGVQYYNEMRILRKNSGYVSRVRLSLLFAATAAAVNRVSFLFGE